jgi:hypothetical protein
MEVTSRHLPRETEENPEEPQDNQCLGSNSNR